MARFGIDVVASSDMAAILREADRVANGVGQRISKLQQRLSAGESVNSQRALTNIQAFGERQIRGQARSGEISITEFKAALRSFREAIAKARVRMQTELGQVVPAPRLRDVRTARQLLDTRPDPEEAATRRQTARARRRSRIAAEALAHADEREAAAASAVSRHATTPRKRGGGAPADKDASRSPSVPTDEEIRELEAFLGNRKSRRGILSRARRGAGPERDLGLQVAGAKERGLSEFDAAQRRIGRPTTGDRAASVEYIRRKRNEDEKLAAARLAEADADLAKATGQFAASRRKFRHASDRALLAELDPNEEAAAKRQRRQFARREAEAGRTVPEAISTVRERRGRQEFRQVVRAVDAGVNPEIGGTAEAKAARDALIAVKERTASLHRSRRAVEQTATSDKRLLQAQAEEIVETAKLAIAKRRQTAAANKEAQRRLDLPPAEGGLSREERGTRFQRLQADIHSRGGNGVRIPAEFQTFRKFAESKAITTAGFALSGAVLYGAVSGIKTIISEAEKLEVVLNQVQAQFNSIGEGDAFSGFRNSILSIARETGAASDEVATIAFQMKGAFGDTTTAVEATSAAIKIAKVTGLELNEIVDSLTASALSFSNASKGITVSVEQVGDVALGLQERFGVLAKETLKGVADVAPVADQVGLKLIEISTLLAGTQQLSGRSGAAIAEGFNRALPALQGVSIEVLKLYSQVPSLAGSLEKLAGQVARGESGQVLLGLLRDFDKFNKTQQSAVFELLGGRREAQFLIPLFGNRKKILNSLDTDLKETGKTQDYFNKLQQTLAITMQRLSESFKQAGEALFRAGLARGLIDVANAAKVFVDIIRIGLTFLAGLDKALGHLPIRLAQAALAFKALTVLVKGLAETKLVGGLLGGRAAAGAAGAVGGRVFGGAFLAKAAGPTAAAPAAATGPLAAFGGVPGILATAGIAGILAYQSKQADRDKNEKALLEKFKKYDTARLQRLAKDRGDFWDRLSGAVFDGRPQSEISQAASKSLALKTTAPEVDDFVASRQAEILKNLNKADRERLERLIQQRTKGKDDPKGAFARARDAIGATSGLLLTPGKDDAPPEFDITPEALDKLQIEALKEPTGKAALTIKTVNEFLRKTAGLGQKFRDAIKGRAANLDLGETKTLINSGQAFQGVQEIESQLQAGLASPIDALQEYRSTIAAFEKVLASGGKLQDDRLREYREIKSKEAKLDGDLARQFADRRVRIEAASGRGTADSALAIYVDLLKSNKVKDPGQRRDLVEQIDKQQDEILQAKIAAGKDAVEQAKIAREGISIPDEARLVELESQLNDLSTVWQNFLKVAFGSVEKGAEFTHETAVGILAGAGTPAELAKSKIAQLRADLLSQRRFARQTGEPTKGIDAQLAALSAVDAGGTDVAVPDAFKRAAEDRQVALDKSAAEEAKRKKEALIKANISLRSARAGTDAVALAQLAVEEADQMAASAKEDGDEAGQIQAAADKVRALRQVDDARVDVLRAQIELAQAISERDPLVVARLTVQQADLALKVANETGGAADKIRAAAEKLRATRQQEDAIADVFKAQKEFAQVVAEIAGDTVGAAEIGVSILSDQLKRTIEAVKNAGGDPANNAEVINLQGQLLQKKKEVQNTDFEKKVGDIDFFLQLEKVTTGQAIAQLTALLQIADPAQTRELLLKIKGLRDQAGQDLQFNTPSDIRLPTLYEVRRRSEAERQGGGYQDFRTISVTMTNNNATDYQGSIDKFTDLIDRAPRVFGTSQRAY